MKQPKISNLILDKQGTKKIRSIMKSVKKIKITINIESEILEEIKNLSLKSGSSYQKLLNQILREGLNKKLEAENRLSRIEKELEAIKKNLKIAI